VNSVGGVRCQATRNEEGLRRNSREVGRRAEGRCPSAGRACLVVAEVRDFKPPAEAVADVALELKFEDESLISQPTSSPAP